ncbi:MAG: squalene/phytoene synthase family protein [Alphaproteobacteria bacterium]
MRSNAIETISPLAADLKANDPDRYIATLFAPPACRESLIALHAFDHELARLQGSLREPMAGLIRLQWWDEVLDDIESRGALNHPVVRGLHRAVTRGDLDVSLLKRALDGRRQPFEEDRPSDLASFERFLLDSGGSMARAAAALLGADDETASALAERVGLVRAAWEQQRLVATPLSDQQPWLPPELHGGHGVGGDDQQPVAGTPLASWASQQLDAARRQSGSIARSALAAFFPGTLAGIRLRDPERSGRQPSLPTAVPRLAWCWLRGRF